MKEPIEAIDICLIGGLCNKLFCLFSACDIAIKNNVKILEPYFGWKKKILFSEIYDVAYFNEKMRKYNNNQDIMVLRENKDDFIIKKDNHNLWDYSEKILAVQRREDRMMKDCMNIVVLLALKLNSNNEQLLKTVADIEERIAIHIRIENDWINHIKHKKTDTNELLFIDIDQLIHLYNQKWSHSKLFFTTGENQSDIKKAFSKSDINSCYIYESELEYEINAAINFELCCRSRIFVGISRSTFSNLITLKRTLINKNNSFIYNSKNEIALRVDHGLHFIPHKVKNNQVIISGL